MTSKTRAYLAWIAALIVASCTLFIGSAMVLPADAPRPKVTGAFGPFIGAGQMLGQAYRSGNHWALLVVLLTFAFAALTYWLIAGRKKPPAE